MRSNKFFNGRIFWDANFCLNLCKFSKCWKKYINFFFYTIVVLHRLQCCIYIIMRKYFILTTMSFCFCSFSFKNDWIMLHVVFSLSLYTLKEGKFCRGKYWTDINALFPLRGMVQFSKNVTSCIVVPLACYMCRWYISVNQSVV